MNNKEFLKRIQPPSLWSSITNIYLTFSHTLIYNLLLTTITDNIERYFRPLQLRVER